MPASYRSDLEREKLDAMKELAYGASHEINNPLANIAARAQTLLVDETHPDRRRALEAIHQQAMRAHEMISDLMLFARPPELVFEKFDLDELVEEIVGRLSPACEQRNIQICRNSSYAPPEIVADRQQIDVAIGAVLSNAMNAVGENGKVSVTIRAGTPDDSAAMSAVVEVADTGPGIPEDVRPHIFDPFFSGREAGRGLGFGLSKCWRIVTDHGGRIEVRNNHDGGATFSLHLPAAPPKSV